MKSISTVNLFSFLFFNVSGLSFSDDNTKLSDFSTPLLQAQIQPYIFSLLNILFHSEILVTWIAFVVSC